MIDIESIDFTGKENEKEFLTKCKDIWEKIANSNTQDVMKLCLIGSIFREIDHRLKDL